MLSPISADGLTAGWERADGGSVHAEMRWDNEAWTVTVRDEHTDVEMVVRLSPTWQVRQFLLFRDLPEPDLWLGTDGAGRWGEVNGAHRPDLDGGTDLALAATPPAHTFVLRRLPLEVGDAVEVRVIDVDVETLGAVVVTHRYHRLAEHRWRWERDDRSEEFDVDDHGLPLDVGPFRRTG